MFRRRLPDLPRRAEVRPPARPPARVAADDDLPLIVLAVRRGPVGAIGLPPEDGWIHHFLEPAFTAHGRLRRLGGRPRPCDARSSRATRRSTACMARRRSSSRFRAGLARCLSREPIIAACARCSIPTPRGRATARRTRTHSSTRKWMLDELYDAPVRAAGLLAGDTCSGSSSTSRIIDGTVNGVASCIGLTSAASAPSADRFRRELRPGDRAGHGRDRRGLLRLREQQFCGGSQLHDAGRRGGRGYLPAARTDAARSHRSGRTSGPLLSSTSTAGRCATGEDARVDVFPILSLITFLPLVGALVIFFWPRPGRSGPGRSRSGHRSPRSSLRWSCSSASIPATAACS